MSASISPIVEGSCEITFGCESRRLGDLAHVVVGDGADLAHLLGDDQVRLEAPRAVRRGVEFVDRLALLRALANLAIDLVAGAGRGRSRRA